ncbi:unnamed protein product, partial [Urochloa humidicola]
GEPARIQYTRSAPHTPPTTIAAGAPPGRSCGDRSPCFGVEEGRTGGTAADDAPPDAYPAGPLSSPCRLAPDDGDGEEPTLRIEPFPWNPIERKIGLSHRRVPCRVKL